MFLHGFVCVVGWVVLEAFVLEVVMPGPPPKKNARRRNARPDWVYLPASGRVGSTPEWPLFVEQIDGWDVVWNDLWGRPQALEWERQGFYREVARYVWCLLVSMIPGTTSAVLSECRQLEDRLGLSPMALKRLQWEIVEDVPEDGRGFQAQAVDGVLGSYV